MPTENRSSNTEMVSDSEMTECQFHNNCGGWCETRRELEHNLCEHCLEAHDEEMASPAQQHKVEPVAWIYSRPEGQVEPVVLLNRASEGDRGSRDETPLYTHADPGEVECWKSTAEHFTGVSIKAAEEVSRLRAKLIELESSVREFLRIDGLSVDGSAARNKALKMLAANLSASAEPSAPVERDDEYDYRTDLAAYFGLSYASWLTLPRVLMEAMPKSWQAAMATLLHQYDDAYPNQPDFGTTVRVTENGKIVRTPEWLENYRHPDHAMLSQLRSEPGKSCDALQRKPS